MDSLVVSTQSNYEQQQEREAGMVRVGEMSMGLGTRRTLRLGFDRRGNLVGEILTAGLGHGVYLREGEWQVGRHAGQHTGWMSEEMEEVGCQAGESL